MDLFTPQGTIKFTLWPASRKINFSKLVLKTIYILLKNTVYIVKIIVKYLRKRRLILDYIHWEHVWNYSFLMLQGDYSAILLQENNVIGFCTRSTICPDNQIRIFWCYNYANEKERLIALEREKTKMESFRNSLKDTKNKAASCFSVT